MYWSDLNELDPVVERAHMDGSGRVMISDNHIETPTNVAVDPLTGLAYWNEFDEDLSRSQIVKYDGEAGVETPLSIGEGLSVIAYGQFVAWDC